MDEIKRRNIQESIVELHKLVELLPNSADSPMPREAREIASAILDGQAVHHEWQSLHIDGPIRADMPAEERPHLRADLSVAQIKRREILLALIKSLAPVASTHSARQPTLTDFQNIRNGLADLDPPPEIPALGNLLSAQGGRRQRHKRIDIDPDKDAALAKKWASFKHHEINSIHEFARINGLDESLVRESLDRQRKTRRKIPAVKGH